MGAAGEKQRGRSSGGEVAGETLRAVAITAPGRGRDDEQAALGDEGRHGRQARGGVRHPAQQVRQQHLP